MNEQTGKKFNYKPLLKTSLVVAEAAAAIYATPFWVGGRCARLGNKLDKKIGDPNEGLFGGLGFFSGLIASSMLVSTVGIDDGKDLLVPYQQAGWETSSYFNGVRRSNTIELGDGIVAKSFERAEVDGAETNFTIYSRLTNKSKPELDHYSSWDIEVDVTAEAPSYPVKLSVDGLERMADRVTETTEHNCKAYMRNDGPLTELPIEIEFEAPWSVRDSGIETQVKQLCNDAYKQARATYEGREE